MVSSGQAGSTSYNRHLGSGSQPSRSHHAENTDTLDILVQDVQLKCGEAISLGMEANPLQCSKEGQPMTVSIGIVSLEPCNHQLSLLDEIGDMRKASIS